jgi:nucleoside-diphosphate-sugar epimerase
MKALVTGGTGFLGAAIVRILVARGDSVRILARGKVGTRVPAGVEMVRGDVAEEGAAGRAAAGCDVVFHTAALAGIAGAEADYRRINVDGTRCVVEACLRQSVPRLVHTSSPSVVFDGTDMEGVDESVPVRMKHEAAYPRTKAEAERIALGASSRDLAVTALRPHLIWGPGDRHLVPRILARARAGRLRRVGDGRNRVDWIYIDNAAEAHVAAADRLTHDSPLAGRAYFLSNGEPVPLWELVDRILAAADLPPVTRSVSPRTALVAGALAEWAWRLLPLPGEPPMTRFVARELATSHWFDIAAARRDLQWEPRVGLEEALSRLRDWIREERV